MRIQIRTQVKFKQQIPIQKKLEYMLKLIILINIDEFEFEN